jgi:hypothetical protein
MAATTFNVVASPAVYQVGRLQLLTNVRIDQASLFLDFVMVAGFQHPSSSHASQPYYDALADLVIISPHS